ncbi:MAG: TIR domain-containing protein [Chloroflexota bacterium]|nr:TIR domain-containing protein [Chloroflexota bacterium]
MARRVFFSFHHKRDSWRIGQVRNCGLGRDREAVGFWDAAEWEKLKLQGETRVRNWIDDNLTNTSVTAVLTGYETWQRPWVRYEIIKSFEKGNGLVGIDIHNIKTQYLETDPRGANPFEYVRFKLNATRTYFDIFEWTGSQWKSYSRIPRIAVGVASRLVGNTIDGQLSQFVQRHDWQGQDGRNQIGVWVEQAAARVGR